MVYDILPSVNLTGDDIRDTLNANGGNVTNEAITWFQDRANINKWAANKPMRHNAMFNLTDDDKKDINYGLFIFWDYDIQSVVEYALNNEYINKTYDYEKPRGENLEPYRISDFINYNSKAVQPSARKMLDYVARVGQYGGLTAHYIANKDYFNTSYCVPLTSLSTNGINFSNSYFGVVVVDKNGELVEGNTCKTTFVGGNPNPPLTDGVYLTVDSYYGRGDYKIVPFISSIKRDWALFKRGDTWRGGHFSILPMHPGTLTIYSQGDIYISVVAYWLLNSSGRYAINYDLYSTNKSNANIDAGIVKMKIGYYNRNEEGINEKIYKYISDLNPSYSFDIILYANTVDFEMRIGGALYSDDLGVIIQDAKYFIEIEPTNHLVTTWEYGVEDR